MINKNLGVCPTCYLIVSNQDTHVLIQKSDETIAYHQECETHGLRKMKKNQEIRKLEGSFCKYLREKNGYDIEEVAEYLGVSESKIKDFEKGKQVSHARLLGAALIMFFKLFSVEQR